MTRILNAWEEHLVHPTLARSLPPLLKRTGFALMHAQVLTAFDLTFSEDRFSYGMASLVADFVLSRQRLSLNEAQAWLEDLQRTAREDHYFFCLNQYLYLVVKPTESLM